MKQLSTRQTGQGELLGNGASTWRFSGKYLHHDFFISQVSGNSTAGWRPRRAGEGVSEAVRQNIFIRRQFGREFIATGQREWRSLSEARSESLGATPPGITFLPSRPASTRHAPLFTSSSNPRYGPQKTRELVESSTTHAERAGAMCPCAPVWLF